MLLSEYSSLIMFKDLHFQEILPYLHPQVCRDTSLYQVVGVGISLACFVTPNPAKHQVESLGLNLGLLVDNWYCLRTIIVCLLLNPVKQLLSWNVVLNLLMLPILIFQFEQRHISITKKHLISDLMNKGLRNCQPIQVSKEFVPELALQVIKGKLSRLKDPLPPKILE